MAEAPTPAGARLHVDGTRLHLSGVLGFATVAAVLEEGRRVIAGMPGAGAVLDLSAVERSDSAGLALVVDWLRAARAHGLDLELRGVPRQLAEIARVSDLDGLLGVEAGDAA